MSYKLFITISCALCFATIQAQNVGININNPLFNLDVRGTDNATDGGEFQLATPGETNFLRLFSGTTEDPHPSLVFSDTDTFHVATTGVKFVRRMTLLPNGKFGLGTDLPIADLDVRAGSTSDPSLINLSTKNGSHFLRLYSGLPSEPYPTLYWNHGDTLGLGMSDFDNSNYQRFLSLNGKTIGVHNTGRSIFIGEGAGANDDLSAKGNVAIGDAAMSNNTDKGGLVAIGDSALHFNGIGAGTDFAVHNTAIGTKTLKDNTTGHRNTAVGRSALQSNTSGDNNSAFGYVALGYNDDGYRNSAFGVGTLNLNVDGHHNSAFGWLALQYNEDAAYNSAFGSYALQRNVAGERNSAVGSNAMYLNRSGNENTAVGNRALWGNRSGSRNVAIGSNALFTDTSSVGNTAIGANSLYHNRDVSYLVAIGDSALHFNGTNASDSTHAIENTAVGAHALKNNTTGSWNTALGRSTLGANIGGWQNTAIGTQAMRHNNSGFNNVAVGDFALFRNEAGLYNTAIGSVALVENDGSNNTAVGATALRYNVDGRFNSAVGSGAMHLNESGDYNTALGTYTMYYADSADHNVAIGYTALDYNSSGSHNVALGSSSLRNSTTGDENVAIGDSTLYVNDGGMHNVAIGSGAGSAVDGQSGNVFIGFEAGKNASQSNRLYIENSSSPDPLIYGEFDNDFLRINGEQEVTDDFTVGDAVFVDESLKRLGVGTMPTTYPLEVAGRANLNKGILSQPALLVNGVEALWYNGTYFSWGFAADYNYFGRPVRIGPVEGGTTPFADLHVLDHTGISNLTIESYTSDAVLQLAGNTDNPNVHWTIRRDASSGDFVMRHGIAHTMTVGTNGNVRIGPTAGGTTAYKLQVDGSAGKDTGGSWSVSSDRRLKQNINTYADGLTEILKIKPVTFQYNETSGYDTAPEHVGVIAQELSEVAPYMVSEKEDGYLDVNNSAMTYMLVNAVQEMHAANEALQATVDQLVAKVNAQEATLQKLTAQLSQSDADEQSSDHAWQHRPGDLDQLSSRTDKNK